MNADRVLVIGLDGATLDLLQPLMEEGHMPFLKGIAERGAMGRLHTVFPPVTAPAWASFMTGKNPGKHGIYEFLLRKDNSFDQTPVHAGMCTAKSLWQILSEWGKRVIVVSVPMTYPPPAVNGCLISGFLAPKGARNLSHPPELLEEVERRFGPYLLYFTEVYTKSGVGRVLQEAFRFTEYRARVAEYLMDRCPWDFCMVYFEGTDRVQHELWHVLDPQHPMHRPEEARRYRDGILAFYRAMDGHLQRLVEKAGPETHVVLMSDHGFGPIHKFVNFNVWLMEQGFLHLKKDAIARIKRFLFQRGITPALGYKIAMRFGFAKLRLSRGMSKRLTLLQLARYFFLSWKDVDWSRTRAYSMGNYGQIFVNLKGREPMGIVEPGQEYEEVRDEIVRRLHELRDPETGQPVVEKVFKKEELYHGPCIGKAPDVSFVLRETYKALGTLEFTSHVVMEPIFGNSGDHRMDGVVALMGKGIKPGAALEKASIMDIAPTVLYLMGLGVPEDMDGRVLTEAFTSEFLLSHPVETMPTWGEEEAVEFTYTAEEAEEIKERLRSLGYLG